MVFSVMLLVVLAFAGSVKEIRAEASFTITEQPQSQDVAFPKGASFHVAVDHPENVASYQWEACDAWGVSEKWFELDSSGTTDTLLYNATDMYTHDLWFRCIITDKDGNAVISERATLHVTNLGDKIPVLYVADYGIVPGESIDFATLGYGTGTVRFDADGQNIYIDNVNVDTTEPVTPHFLSESMGLYLMVPSTDVLEFYMHFSGAIVFKNMFFDSDTNSCGVTIGAYFEGDSSGNKPSLIMDGDSLTLDGGTHIYTNSNLEINLDLTNLPNGDNYCDSINCDNLIIGANKHVKIGCNGSAIHTDADLRIEDGAVVELEAYAPHVSVGATVKQAIFASGSIYMKNAQLIIRGGAKTVNFIPYGSGVGMFAAVNMANGGHIDMDNSKIDVELTVEESGGDPYVYNLYGIVGGDPTSSLTLENGSTVSLKANNKEAFNSCAISLGGKVILNGGSRIDIDFAGPGETSGIETDLIIDVNESSIDSKVVSLSGDKTYGIVGDEINIAITDAANSIHSIAENGYALAASTGELSDEEVGYAADYKPVRIHLGDALSVNVPKKGVISTFTIPAYGSNVIAETVFDPQNTAAPATEVTIGLTEKSNSNVWLYAGGALVLCAALFAFTKLRKKQA